MFIGSKNWQDYWKEIVNCQRSLTINVTDFEGSIIGELCPITNESLGNSAVIGALTEWRNKYGRFFFTEFEAKDDRTRQWLKESVLADGTQMLFLIYFKGSLIGQYGFKNLSEKTALMDNLIRGIAGGHPKLIERAMMALVSWLFQNLEIDSVTGSVLSDNPFAMIVNRAVGFEYLNDNKQTLPDGRYSRDIILTREHWNIKKSTWWQLIEQN
jgi:RimJ/RimL family protein N-acetyltransferase